MSPEICPNCGASVPPDATACPACGSDERTGWSEHADAGHLDLPDEEFDYGEFVQREFGPGQPKPPGMGWFWWSIALLLLAVLLTWWLH